MAKRVFDLFCAALGLLALSPLFFFVAILIKITSPGPVFFRQRRMGRNLKPFWLYKFRSMTANSESRGNLVTAKGDKRITPVGRVLRTTKFDELPQLFNVLKGEMSLIGPRPEVPRYVDLFPNEHRIILSVRPGITDWASIHGVNEEAVLSQVDDVEKAYCEMVLPAKMKLQMEYVRNRSFQTDLKIILATPMAIAGKLAGKRAPDGSMVSSNTIK